MQPNPSRTTNAIVVSAAVDGLRWGGRTTMILLVCVATRKHSPPFCEILPMAHAVVIIAQW
eukprot:4704683-Amphidinium_carterae.2